MTVDPAFAAADWGTTRLRVWTIDDAGGVIAERRSDEGLLSAQPDRFADILERTLGDMGAPAALPVVICGMAGSRQGWIEAPYAGVPASLDAIFSASVLAPGTPREVRIVPGLAQRDADAPDVMRGEETQLAGATARLGRSRCVVCMPGTHSKWVEVSDGAVLGFQTFMTGELFSVLATKSILSHSLGEDATVANDNPRFGKACLAALRDEDALAVGLFRLRAGTLLEGLTRPEAAATLSGLLIGTEIAAARRRLTLDGDVVLIASGAMRLIYQTALALAGIRFVVVDADEAVRAGLAEAARHFGFIPSARARP